MSGLASESVLLLKKLSKTVQWLKNKTNNNKKINLAETSHFQKKKTIILV